MKKKIFSGVFALVILLIAGYGVNRSMNSYADLSDLALKNVLALANIENPDPGEAGGEGNFQIGTKTVTTEIYETNSPGWTWSGSLKLWLFNGQTTQTWPSEYTKTTTSVGLKCCQPMGDQTNCPYELC